MCLASIMIYPFDVLFQNGTELIRNVARLGNWSFVKIVIRSPWPFLRGPGPSVPRWVVDQMRQLDPAHQTRPAGPVWHVVRQLLPHVEFESKWLHRIRHVELLSPWLWLCQSALGPAEDNALRVQLHRIGQVWILKKLNTTKLTAKKPLLLSPRRPDHVATDSDDAGFRQIAALVEHTDEFECWSAARSVDWNRQLG